MEHIKTEYGTACNFLKLTSGEYRALEPFMTALGIRARVEMWHYEDGVEILKIQADNPYKDSLVAYSGLNDAVKNALKSAELEMKRYN